MAPLSAMIGPSILNADLSQLYDESQRLIDNGADYLVRTLEKFEVLIWAFDFPALGRHGREFRSELDVRSSCSEVFKEQNKGKQDVRISRLFHATLSLRMRFSRLTWWFLTLSCGSMTWQ